MSCIGIGSKRKKSLVELREDLSKKIKFWQEQLSIYANDIPIEQELNSTMTDGLKDDIHEAAKQLADLKYTEEINPDLYFNTDDRAERVANGDDPFLCMYQRLRSNELPHHLHHSMLDGNRSDEDVNNSDEDDNLAPRLFLYSSEKVDDDIPYDDSDLRQPWPTEEVVNDLAYINKEDRKRKDELAHIHAAKFIGQSLTKQEVRAMKREEKMRKDRLADELAKESLMYDCPVAKYQHACEHIMLGFWNFEQASRCTGIDRKSLKKYLLYIFTISY
jgi:hypothetical protein